MEDPILSAKGHMGYRVLYVDESVIASKALPLNAERVAILCHLFKKYNGMGFVDRNGHVAKEKALRSIVTIQGYLGDIWMNNFALSDHFVVMMVYRPASFNKSMVCYSVGMDLIIDEKVKYHVAEMGHDGDDLIVKAGGVCITQDVPGLNDIFDDAEALSNQVQLGYGTWKVNKFISLPNKASYDVEDR
jgi:hypothetical protein